MKRGKLIAYDENGKVWEIQGEAEGDVLPYEMPIGNIKIVELPIGSTNGIVEFKYNDRDGIVPIITIDTIEVDQINLALLEAEGGLFNA